MTAGAPIARFNIPGAIGVTAFEADGDPVARLDGAENFRGTIHGLPAVLDSERNDAFHVPGPVRIHNADRYARMAQQSDVDTSSDFSFFFGGDEKEVFNYYGVRGE